MLLLEQLNIKNYIMKNLFTVSFLLIFAFSANAQFGKLKKATKKAKQLKNTTSVVEQAKTKVTSGQEKLKGKVAEQAKAKIAGEQKKLTGKVGAKAQAGFGKAVSGKKEVIGTIENKKKKLKGFKPKL